MFGRKKKPYVDGREGQVLWSGVFDKSYLVEVILLQVVPGSAGYECYEDYHWKLVVYAGLSNTNTIVSQFTHATSSGWQSQSTFAFWRQKAEDMIHRYEKWSNEKVTDGREGFIDAT